jgi:hypothetical protein
MSLLLVVTIVLVLSTMLVVKHHDGGVHHDGPMAGKWRSNPIGSCANWPKPNKCAIRGNKHGWTRPDERE